MKRRVPFWYRQGVKASSIEATAFALLVFLQHSKVNVDAIADWLVSQRNHKGAFNGAMVINGSKELSMKKEEEEKGEEGVERVEKW